MVANVYGDMSQASYLRYFLKIPKDVYHLHEGTTQTISLEEMVKGMHACIPVATSRNVPMMSIRVHYILKALGIKFSAP